MISNEHSTKRGHAGPGRGETRHAIAEESIKTERVQIERKTFVFALKENVRGRFLRITEDLGGRRDAIIVPATGLEEFRRVLDDMIQASAARPDPAEPPDPGAP